LTERAARVALWLNQNFLTGDELEAADAGHFTAAFTSLRRPDGELRIAIASDGAAELRSTDMDLCGDVVQSLAEYLGLEDLASECDFPKEMEELETLLGKADELQSVRYDTCAGSRPLNTNRQRLSAELADNSGLIRTLVVRAEDARLMMDMKTMRQWYSQLYDINRDLISGYNIRCANHQELMETLKAVNQIIQKAGRLRGKEVRHELH